MKYAPYIVGLALMLMSLSAVAGCQLDRYVKAQTPTNIQKTDGLPAKIPLAEVHDEYALWLARMQSDAAQWRGNIEDAEYIHGLFGNLTLAALDEAGPVIAGLPVGGALLPVLAGAVALFLKRPGDKSASETAAEKEASFNAGLKKAAALLGGNPDTIIKAAAEVKA